MQEIWVWSLGGEDPLEKGMAAHSSTLARRIPWTRGWWATVHSVTESDTTGVTEQACMWGNYWNLQCLHYEQCPWVCAVTFSSRIFELQTKNNMTGNVFDDNIQEPRTVIHSDTWRRLVCSETEWSQLVERSQIQKRGRCFWSFWGHDSNCSWRLHCLPAFPIVWMFNSFYSSTTKTFFFSVYTRSNGIFCYLQLMQLWV